MIQVDLRQRVTQAEQQQWFGDVEQLRVTLDHLQTKKDQAALPAGLPTTAVLTAAAPTTISLPFIAG